ncbi:hypothetical protein SASPL_134545 [Salvia splendens]|uniref:RING-type domain-containing protein n=1 Tax=Salvia splendens TaxID=180675 RepID=A0A8X8X541_SALSN|nr:hypothetical protein SASPL_134545 [Salvia splendens]
MYNSNVDGRISRQVPYFNTPNLLDHHPPYIPPFQVAGLAPGLPHEENELDSQWNLGLEAKKKRPIEQVFLNKSNSNNNSQISSVDLLQARSVSTGLGLSLDNPRLASSGDSALLGLVGDALDRELQRQDAEIDRYIKVQGERLRQGEEAEVEDINKKNVELELRMEQLALEANAWQQQANYSENMINALKHNLEQAYAQSRDSKEGCGYSEVDDTASCSNGGLVDFLLRRKDRKELMRCKVCRVKEVCMLLLPCKHVCLCKECESKLSVCPLCQSSKYIGMEVYV